MSLQQKVVNGMMWSGIGQFCSLAVSFLSNIVLARLLVPADFGCIGMLTIFLTVSQAFIHGGFGQALIQKKNPTQVDYSTIFYWNLVVSILFIVILYFCAPFISNFYGIPKLTSLLRVMSLDLIIVALSIVPTNILKKRLQFNDLAKRTIISTIISTILTIILAYCGWGVWSIVFHQLSKSFIVLLMLWKMVPWKPSWCFSFSSFKELFGFGSMMLLSNLISTIYDNIVGLIVGKCFSATQLGYYSQARKLEQVPTMSLNSVVNEVSFSAFSSIQDQRARLLSGVRKNMNSVAFVACPTFLLLVVVAPDLIPLLYGPKWEPSIPMFQLLCICGMFFPLIQILSSTTKAIGKAKLFFYIFLLNRTVGLSFFLFGIQYGITGLIIGKNLASIFSFCSISIVCSKTILYKIKFILKDFLPNLLISLVSAGVVYYLFSLFTLNGIVEMVFEILLFAGLYLSASYFLKIEGMSIFLQLIHQKLKR